MRKEIIAMNRVLLIFLATIIVYIGLTLIECGYAIANPSAFETVLERVAEITSNDNWRLRDWKDQKLEDSLSLIMEKVRELTKNDKIELPVGFNSVYPLFDNDISSIVEQRMIVTKKGKVSNAKNSIIIADQSIDISFAENCLIISRGIVDVAHGSGNVILSGHYIEVSHDRSAEENSGNPINSVMLSGAMVHVSHAKGTIICAPSLVDISSADNVTLINSPHIDISHEKNVKHLVDNHNILPSVSVKPEWVGKLKITQIVPARSHSKALIVVKITGVELVMRIGDSIPQATDELKGWKLMFVEDNFALFEKEGQFVSTTVGQE